MTAYASPSLTIRDREFVWGSRTYVMGIVNLSPESFSGDGLSSVDDAVEQARRFVAEGADILDIGGQSTRPGFKELTIDEEIERVVPAIRAIVAAVGVPVSIDTYRVEVAEAALRAGASVVNDVWGLRHDPAMPRLVAGWGVPAIVMHNQRGRDYNDAISDIRKGFEESLALADDAGIERTKLILDPGFGFGWSSAQDRSKNIQRDLDILRRLGELRDFGLPILSGTSRKSTISHVLRGLAEDQRGWGTAATVALSIANGADIVRVHDVAEMVQVARMTDAVVRPGV